MPSLLSDLSFSLDAKASLIALPAIILFVILWRQRKHFSEPRIFFSDVTRLEEKAGRSKWASLPHNLMLAALAAMMLAFIDPHFYLKRSMSQAPGQINPLHYPTEGLAIYLVLDQSGSMKEEVETAGRRRIPKVALLRDVTRRFIAGDAKLNLNGRPNDMIGLIAFARGARVLSPLTLDHTAVLDELDRFAPVEQRSNDGTSIGYAIFKTANMIAATRHYAEELAAKGEPAYTIKKTVMILITDGLQDPNPLDKGKRLRNMDVPEAAAYAKKEGVRLYIINVEPKLATEEFAPYRHIMQRAAELTGGKFFMVDNTGNLSEIYRSIDKLEKSELPAELQAHVNKEERPDLYQRVSLYPYLIAIGLLALLIGLMLDFTVLRRIP